MRAKSTSGPTAEGTLSLTSTPRVEKPHTTAPAARVPECRAGVIFFLSSERRWSFSACAKIRCVQSDRCEWWSAGRGHSAGVRSSGNDVVPAKRGEPIPQRPMLGRINIELVSASRGLAVCVRSEMEGW